MDVTRAVMKDLELHAVLGGVGQYAAAVDCLDRHQAAASQLLAHAVPLTSAPHAFARLDSPRDGAPKLRLHVSA